MSYTNTCANILHMMRPVCAKWEVAWWPRPTHRLKTYTTVTYDFCKLPLHDIATSSSPLPLFLSPSPSLSLSLSLFLGALVVSLGKLITHPVWFLHSVFWERFRLLPHHSLYTERPRAHACTFAGGFRWACCKLSIWWNRGLCRTVFSRESFSCVGASPLSFSVACSLSTASKARWVSAEELYIICVTQAQGFFPWSVL